MWSLMKYNAWKMAKQRYDIWVSLFVHVSGTLSSDLTDLFWLRDLLITFTLPRIALWFSIVDRIAGWVTISPFARSHGMPHFHLMSHSIPYWLVAGYFLFNCFQFHAHSVQLVSLHFETSSADALCVNQKKKLNVHASNIIMKIIRTFITSNLYNWWKYMHYV